MVEINGECVADGQEAFDPSILHALDAEALPKSSVDPDGTSSDSMSGYCRGNPLTGSLLCALLLLRRRG